MPITVRQLTSSYELRYQNTGHVPHRNFSEGMIRDVASWELPEGACYDASDMLCDLTGKIRKRGGTTSPASGNSAATVENLASFKSNGPDAITALVGSSGKTGAITKFTTSTGATTTLSSALAAPVWACRPFQHRNLLVLSTQMLAATANDTNRFWLWGGGTAGSSSASSGTVTAGDNRITGLTGAALNSGHLGSFIAAGGSSGTIRYFGRITEVTSSTAVRVEPIPTISITLDSVNVYAIMEPSLFGATYSYGLGAGDVTGRYGVSFQGRIVLGDIATTRDNGRGDYPTNGLRRYPRRLQWSLLSTETPTQPGGYTLDGDNVLMPGLFTNTGKSAAATYNYQDIDSLQTMTGLAAMGDGQLVIFGPNQMFRLTGRLATETVDNNSLNYSVDQVSDNVGCIAARSIQYARDGLIWAGGDNIYLYNGSKLTPILKDRNARYYQNRLAAGDVVYGSAYSTLRNHYYLSMGGTDGGLMLNLETLAMTRLTNVQLFDSTPDPTNATQLWGARWWDTIGTAPTMTKGQLIRIDPIWTPTSANKTDADGTAVLATFQSKAYMDGTLESNKLYNQLHVDYDLRGTGSPTATVTADTELNTPDAVYQTLTQGTLPNTGSTSGTAHMDTANQLAEGKALEVKVVQNAASDSFELLGLNIGFQQRALT